MVDKFRMRRTGAQLIESLVHGAPNDCECNVSGITVGHVCRHSSSSSSSTNMTSSTVSGKPVERQERGDPCSSEISAEQLLTKPIDTLKTNKNVDHDQERGDPCQSAIPEWQQEFRENLVDDRVPEHRDSHASSSHGSSLEPTPARSADLGKHSVYTHFPKDHNCDVSNKTKITRAPCRRRIGRVVPRAENFGDLITADHKVLSEGC